ncbi:MAG: O-antigen polymerase [Solirubrobacterales bacterium]
MVIFSPVAYRLLSGGRSSWLEPVVWAGATMGVMFVVRPAALLANDQLYFRGYGLAKHFDEVLVLTMLGAASLYAGYFVLRPKSVVRRIPPIPDASHDGMVVVFSFACILAGLAMYGVSAAQSGVSAWDALSTGFATDSRKSSAYLYMAPTMALPAALLLYRTGTHTGSRWLKASGWAFALLFAGILAPAGNRFTAILFIAPFLLYIMLLNGWRVRLVPAVTALAVVLGFVVTTQNFRPGEQGLSAVGSGFQTTVTHPSRAWQTLVLGPTIEMFDGLVVERQLVPDRLGYRPGSAIVTTIAQPIPRLVWPDKPYVSDAVVNEAAFGNSGVRAGDASVAYSPIGGFYYDSGWIGVMLGMALIGILLRLMWDYFENNRSNDLVRLAYSIGLPLSVLLMRGNLADTLARALFAIGPLVLIAIASSRTVQAVRTSGDGRIKQGRSPTT